MTSASDQISADRSRLAAMTLELLGSGPPRTAREIAAIVRMRAGFESVQRHHVNSVLYFELGDRVERDDQFRWRPSGRMKGAAPEARPQPAGQDGQRPGLLRTIHRLRGGLPPYEHLEDLTVAPERVMTSLRDFFSPRRSQRWLIIAGEYGTGKTHSLSLIRELAMRSRFAACYLSADGYGSALNHPQRFLHMLLSTLELPGHNARGYEELLHGMLMDRAGASRLQDLLGPYLLTGREIDRGVRSHFTALTSARGHGNPDNDGEAWRREQVCYYLAGHSITHRAGADARAMAYLLLRMALDVVVAMGAQGLMVLVDEVESIYTKLPSQSRMAAYRVLAALCESGFFPECCVAIAMTPDACRELAVAVPGMLLEADSPVEPIRSLARALAGEAILTLQCRPLTRDVRGQLLDRVKALYLKAYEGSFDVEGFQDAWVAHVERLTARDVPVRVLVRQAVDFLDRIRYPVP